MPKPGDILAVRGTGFLSRGILAATGDSVSHVGLVITADPFPIVIEALTRVMTRPLTVSIAAAEHAWLLSDSSMTDEARSAIVAAALAFSADGYGYTDIGLQLANAVGRTTWFTDHLATGLNGKPICSYLVAAAYETRGRTFGQADQTTTPADIFHYAARHNQYVITQVK